MNRITLALTAIQLHDGHRRSICDAAGVSYSWMSKFATGQIKDPGVEVFDRFYDELDKRGSISKARDILIAGRDGEPPVKPDPSTDTQSDLQP